MVWGLPGSCQLPTHCPPPLPLQGNTVESEHLSELTEEEYEAHYVRRQDLKGFLWLDAKYLNPFFTRRLTQEVGPGQHHTARGLSPGPERGGQGRAGKAHVLRLGEGQPSHCVCSAFSPAGAQAACAVASAPALCPFLPSLVQV